MTFPFNAHPDYEFYGFDRTELERFLNAHSKSLNGQEAASMAAQTYPAWGKDLTGIDEFTIRQCAWLLCGVHPMADGYPSNDDWTDHAVAVLILETAMKRGELNSIGADPNGVPLLNGEDVRLWCPTVRRTWPIPPRPETTAPSVTAEVDADLTSRLQQAAQQNATLQKSIQALEADKTALTKSVADLRSKLQAFEVRQTTRWPWGAHETKDLKALEAAAIKWWVNFDPSDHETAPRNEDVSGWLQSTHKISKTKANGIASMLRADGLPTGPRT